MILGTTSAMSALLSTNSLIIYLSWHSRWLALQKWILWNCDTDISISCQGQTSTLPDPKHDQHPNITYLQFFFATRSAKIPHPLPLLPITLWMQLRRPNFKRTHSLVYQTNTWDRDKSSSSPSMWVAIVSQMFGYLSQIVMNFFSFLLTYYSQVR